MQTLVSLASVELTTAPSSDSLLASGFEQAREEIVARGRERGFVTSDDLLELLPEGELTPEQIEEFLRALERALEDERIDVIEIPGDKADGDESIESRLAARLKTQTFDPIRMYLRDIGRVPLLTAAQEVDLAMRIEAGKVAAELLAHPAVAPPVQRLKFRALVRAVVRIRVHQLDPAWKLQREGIGRETISGSYRPNGPAEMAGFLGRVQADGDVARSRLIEANLRLVVSVARRYVTQRMTLLDLAQEGNLGLMHAVAKYDYTLGYKFSTYATWWIRQSVIRAVADKGRVIRIPGHIGEHLNRLRGSQRQLTQQLGREPRPEEIALAMGISAPRVREILTVSKEPLSLAMPLGEDDDSYLGDLVEDPIATEAYEAVGAALLNGHLRAVLQTLPPREERVMVLRFGLADGRPRTLEETGREFGVTRERIRQIESKAMAKLRHPSRSNLLRDYLD